MEGRSVVHEKVTVVKSRRSCPAQNEYRGEGGGPGVRGTTVTTLVPTPGSHRVQTHEGGGFLVQEVPLVD